MATTDASYSFTLKVKPSASNSYKIGIPFCPASFFDESTINLKIVWGDGSSDTELTTLASATDNILLEHTYTNELERDIEIHGGYGADSNFEGGKIAFPQSSKHDTNGIAQDQAVPTGSTLDKISQLIFENVVKHKPATGFYIHGQGDFQNFTKLWAHRSIVQFRNFIWSDDPASEIKHVGDKNFGYICFDKTFENCHTGFAYTSDSNHTLYPTGFLQPLNGGGWQMASRRSKSFQRTFANSKVNARISGWGPSRFAKSARQMFKDNTVFSRNINNLFATGNENSLTDMEGMFENTQAFSKHMLNWNTSKVTNMINVFKNSKYDRRLDTWDVAKVTSMKGFLEGNTDYASGDGGDYRDIKEWFDPYLNPDGSKRDASNPRTFAIESFEDMFKNSSINVDISTWDTSTVTNMKNVFRGNTAFDQDISNWDISNVSTDNLDGFAKGATGLTASEVPSRVPSPESVAPDSLSGSWTQIGDNIHGEAAYDFSYITSINSDGTILAIGGYGNVANSSGYNIDTYVGHVRVYEQDANATSGWTQLGNDIDADQSDGDTQLFGSSISMNSDGTILVIGAPMNSIGHNTTDIGYARVYQRNTNTTSGWTQLGSDIDGDIASDYFGYSVSMNSDGTILAIGAHNPQNTSSTSLGYVKVYERDTNATSGWTQLGNNIDGDANRDYFGYSVSMNSDGTILAIGAPEISTGDGYVKVYERDTNTTSGWTQLGNDIVGDDDSGMFGHSVSMNSDGTILAIGSRTSSTVKIYERDTNATLGWTQIGSDISGASLPNTDRFGNSVSLNANGNVVLIGAPRSDAVNRDSGHASVYQNISGTWTQVGDDLEGDGDRRDKFGSSVSINSDGTIIAVGSNGSDGPSNQDTVAGHVSVFELS